MEEDQSNKLTPEQVLRTLELQLEFARSRRKTEKTSRKGVIIAMLIALFLVGTITWVFLITFDRSSIPKAGEGTGPEQKIPGF